jgi:hypothetical protein
MEEMGDGIHPIGPIRPVGRNPGWSGGAYSARTISISCRSLTMLLSG